MERAPAHVYRVIERHVTAGISLIIPYVEYRRVFAGKRYASNPYHFAFSEIIAHLAQHQHRLGLTEPVDFIFDRGNDDRIQRAWNKFFASAPPEVTKLLGKRPEFGDDETMLPLQAADFLAWWRRRNFAARHGGDRSRPPPKLKSRELWYLDFEWTPARIQQAYYALYGKGGALS